MKKLVSCALTAVLCVCLALGFAGCGANNANTIVVWCEATGSDKQVMDEFVKYFNDNNEFGYTMTYKMQDSVTASISTASMGGSAPDIAVWPRWETVSKNKLVHDLTQKIEESDVINLSDYNEAAQRELTVKGKTYGVSTRSEEHTSELQSH